MFRSYRTLTTPLPVAGSGINAAQRLRFWFSPATSDVGIASPVLSVAGVFLLPLDGPAGVLPRGLAYPSTLSWQTQAELRLDGIAPQGVFLTKPKTSEPLEEARQYLGALPRVGASTLRVELLGGARNTASGATAPVIRESAAFADASLVYRPRFAFVRGL
jgi:hypothetical protein